MTILNRFTNNSVKTLVDAATIVLDAEDAPHYQVTITANRTLGNPSNPAFAKEMWIAISQDAVGGHTLAFASDWVAIDPTVTLNPTPNTISVLHATARNFGSGIKWYYSIDSNTTSVGGGGSAAVNTMAALATTPGTAGQTIEVLGYWLVNDGGGGSFYWAAGSALATVPGMIISATGGQWIRRLDMDFLSAKWFGARGDRVSRPLSTLYGTFAAAKADYPHITKRVRGTLRFTASAGAFVYEGYRCSTVPPPPPPTIPPIHFRTVSYAAESGGFVNVVVESEIPGDPGSVLPAGTILNMPGGYSGLSSADGVLQAGGTVLESDAAALARYELDEVAIQRAITFMEATGTAASAYLSTREVFIPGGEYLIKNMLVFGDPYGYDKNSRRIRGAGLASYAYATTLYWANPTEVGAVLNMKGFDNVLDGIGFYTETGCTSFAGVLLKNGTWADRDESYFGTFTSRCDIRNCGFGNLADNLATTKSQRGIGLDSLFPTDGNIEQLLVSRCSFSNCMLSIDIAGAQPYTFVVRESAFLSRPNTAGSPYGISFYSNTQGGRVPYDMEVYGCEFQRQYVNKHSGARSSRWYGNSTENCKRFWTSGYNNLEVNNACHEFRGMRWNLTGQPNAFDVWTPVSVENPKNFVLSESYPELTNPTDTPPYWIHFGKNENVNISACHMEAGAFEIDGDFRQQGIIARNMGTTITSMGNWYISKRPFVVDEYRTWGQSPYQTDTLASGVTSIGDSVWVNPSRVKEPLAPMHNTNNPVGKVIISDTATSAAVNWSWPLDYDGLGPNAAILTDHDRGAIWDPAIIGSPGPLNKHDGFFEFSSNPIRAVDTCVSASTGTPAAGAYQTYVTRIGRHGFLIHVAEAPGAGNSVTISYRHWR